MIQGYRRYSRDGGYIDTAEVVDTVDTAGVLDTVIQLEISD